MVKNYSLVDDPPSSIQATEKSRSTSTKRRRGWMDKTGPCRRSELFTLILILSFVLVSDFAVYNDWIIENWNGLNSFEFFWILYLCLVLSFFPPLDFAAYNGILYNELFTLILFFHFSSSSDFAAYNGSQNLRKSFPHLLLFLIPAAGFRHS